MLGGVPQQSGLPGKSVRVTHFGGVSFLHVKAAEWGNPPTLGTRGFFSRCSDMDTRGEALRKNLWRRAL